MTQHAPIDFTVADLYHVQRITEIDASRLHGRAVCAVQSIDRERDAYVSRLWLFDPGTDAPRPLTFGHDQDNAPRWSPDGRYIAFLSDRRGSPQLYLLDLEGGEARPVGTLQNVSALRWCADGRTLVVTASVAVDPDRRGAPGPARPEAKGRCQPEVAWRLPYKEDGIGYVLARQFHLFSVDLDSGAYRQLTQGAFDVLGFDVTGDGRIAFTRTRDGRFAHDNDLWVCDATGEGLRQLTRDHAIVMSPTWSPDGSCIAFTGAREEGDAEPRLWLVDMAEGRTRCLRGDDVDVAHPAALGWASDGRSLTFTRAHRGRHQIATLRIDDEWLDIQSTGDRQIGVFASSQSRLYFTVDHPAQGPELHLIELDRRTHRPTATGLMQVGPAERCLSGLNGWWAQRMPIEVEPVLFDVPGGQGGTERIEGWLIAAAGLQGPRPTLIDAHGGPASYALLDYDSNVFWQVLCSRGWRVLALNAVGSASYGREFCRRLTGHWGELDLPQYEEAMAQLRQRGLSSQFAISGKSYGGYLSALAAGRSLDLSAAVVMAPVGNIETHYGTSDGGYYADPFYIASKPQFDRERARALSPLQIIENATTPTLFLQGKDDERCPRCQSEELFVSLARAGDTPCELVLYPGEGHGFLGSGAPSCRGDAAQRILDWLEQHVAGSGRRS